MHLKMLTDLVVLFLQLDGIVIMIILYSIIMLFICHIPVCVIYVSAENCSLCFSVLFVFVFNVVLFH